MIFAVCKGITIRWVTAAHQLIFSCKELTRLPNTPILREYSHKEWTSYWGAGHFVDAIGLSYRWHDELIKSGSQITEFAKEQGIARTRIIKLLPLTQLGPEVLRHALAGTLPSTITLDDLLTASIQLDWDRQAAS